MKIRINSFATVAASILVLGVCGILASTAIAQDNRNVSESAVRQTGEGKGQDAAGRDGINAEEVPAPASKGGEPSAKGAGDCLFIGDNWTGYYIDLYLDDYYVGTVSPWGEASGFVAPGRTELYGEAPGTDLFWGPQMANLPAYGEYTWSLY